MFLCSQSQDVYWCSQLNILIYTLEKGEKAEDQSLQRLLQTTADSKSCRKTVLNDCDDNSSEIQRPINMKQWK